MCSLLLYFIASNFLTAFAGESPSFCVDPFVRSIFDKRLHGCLDGTSVITELANLRANNVNEFQRAHELVAYDYFLSDHNRHRVAECTSADFEYVPMLPLAWKIGFSTQTECTAGGNCPRSELSSSLCSVEELIKSIVQYIKYANSRPAVQNRPRFIVSSTFNLKAVLGFGLPMQQRRGTVFEIVTSFIESTMIGHYERLPQCADLLRKPWLHVVELPYIVHDVYLGSALSSGTPKQWNFFFGGRLQLWGSERVCSVRVAMANHVATRLDSIVFNITAQETFGPPISDSSYFSAMRASTFCLIARGDSYSSASFYNAIQTGCVPIVISDWFVFSFWWLVPYDKFVIRIPEELFLKNADAALDHVLRAFSPENISQMQQAMSNWRDFLGFKEMLPIKTHHIDVLGASKLHVFDAFLMEMQKARLELASSSHEKRADVLVRRNDSNPVVCRDPISCAPGVSTMTLPLGVEDTRSHLCKHSPRLIGKYKIVYFMRCVKMLWPLRPANFLPRSDLIPGGITENEMKFVKLFHNVSEAQSNQMWYTFPSPVQKDINRIKRVRHETK